MRNLVAGQIPARSKFLCFACWDSLCSFRYTECPALIILNSVISVSSTRQLCVTTTFHSARTVLQWYKVCSLWAYARVKATDDGERKIIPLFSCSSCAWNLREHLLFWGKDENGPKQGANCSQLIRLLGRCNCAPGASSGYRSCGGKSSPGFWGQII